MVSADDIDITTLTTVGATGALTVTGPGSTLTQNGASELSVGHATDGTATVDVAAGAVFTTGTGTTTINATASLDVNSAATFNALGEIDLSGTINLVGGTIDAVDINFNGGVASFPFGTLRLGSDQSFDAARMADLDVDTIGPGKTVAVGGTTTLLSPLLLAGGSLTADAYVNPQLVDFQYGTLGFTGAGGLTIGAAGPLGTSPTISASQHVDVTNALSVDNGATLTLSDGSVSASTMTNNGRLTGSGNIDGTFVNHYLGEVEVLAGSNLVINSATSTNNNLITLTGGQVHFTGSLTNNGPVFGNGTIRADGGIDNNGTIAFSATANVIGDVTNSMGTIYSSGGTTTFFDDVENFGDIQTGANSFTIYYGSYSGSGTNSGTGTVIMAGDLTPGTSPGSMAFDGDLSFTPTASLEIEIDGPLAGSEHDIVTVAGTATLAGALDVVIDPLFTPQPGDVFSVLTYGTRVGEFDAITGLDFGSGMSLTPIYGATDLQLVVQLPGDGNGDGMVDGLDYLLWAANYGDDPAMEPPGSPENGDYNDDGMVDGLDYLIWAGQFGAGSATAVPEPGSTLLWMTGAYICAVGRPRRKTNASGSVAVAQPSRTPNPQRRGGRSSMPCPPRRSPWYNHRL